jgi:Domain of unknown function (DUF4253)
MKHHFQLIFSIVLLVLISNCNSKNTTQYYKLTDIENKICDTLQIDTTIIQDVRTFNINKIESFHYALSKMYKDGQENEIDPISLNGLVLNEQNAKSYDLIFSLKDNFRKKGYTIFLLENNFDIDKKPDKIGILKTTDKYLVLKQIATNGINHDISNDSLITIIQQLDKKYSLELIGASGDWCEFIINHEPNDWNGFAKEVYKICPDVVDQGTGTIEILADEMKSTKRLYFWWD